MSPTSGTVLGTGDRYLMENEDVTALSLYSVYANRQNAQSVGRQALCREGGGEGRARWFYRGWEGGALRGEELEPECCGCLGEGALDSTAGAWLL